MEVYEIAYLFLGLATIVAAGTIINYSRKRSAATTDPELKAAFRPLYIFAIGMIVFGIGALLTYYELLIQVPWIQIPEVTNTYYYLLYYFTLGELFFFVVSGTMITKVRIIGVFMIIVLLIAFLLMFNAIIIIEAQRISSIAQNYIDFGYVLSMIILGFVAGLFTVIARDTKRSTSMALGFAMIVQVLAVPGLYNILPTDLIVAIAIFSLMGPAMITFAFLRPDQKISGELLGYGAAFAVPVFIIASLFTTGYISDITVVTIAISGAIAIMLTAGSASYSYGRWRETKQSPTALLMVSFASFSMGQMVGILGSIDIMDKGIAIYFDLVASSFALVLFAVFSVLAAGYRTTASLPLIIYLPAIIFTVSTYPDPISVAVIRWIYLVLPVMALFFIPVVIFFRVWRRMKAAGTAGRMRPLGLSIGLLVYILIRFPLMLVDFEPLDPSYGLISIAFFVLWLSTTGRLDRIRQ
ncbi:hypothetical protein EU528_04265 [Candidatus Thorarchaeota archaeon]|nr:MAG: hypothetical protein EU528_04265 [Candidatus Thorarchaeota archaeon]